jgi:hypothetical protein
MKAKILKFESKKKRDERKKFEAAKKRVIEHAKKLTW